MTPDRTAAGLRNGERGLALVMALLFTLIVSGITITGTMMLKTHIQKNRTAWASKSQALQVARSGLAEAVSWMRRQTSQPVLALEPQLDAAATPPVLDTLDETIGLVREFKITGKVYARYEVWKRWDADPDAERRAWRQQFQCEDVSAQRAGASAGTVWRVRSIGYIYNRVDAAVPFNQEPNSVIASQVAVNECRRLVLRLPGSAAVNTGNGTGCLINTYGRVIGGTAAGIYYPAGSGTPTTGALSLNRVTGTPRLATAVDYDDGYEAVFGMNYEQIKSIATMVVTSTAGIPSPMPTGGLVIIETGSAVTFDATKPLTGNAVVIVRGNCTLSVNSNSNFSGLLYVNGNFTMRQPPLIRGSLICTGNMTVQGSTDYATIQYDGNVISQLMSSISNYTPSNTPLLPRHSR